MKESTEQIRKHCWGRRGAGLTFVVALLAWVVVFILALRSAEHYADVRDVFMLPAGTTPAGSLPIPWCADDHGTLLGVVEVDALNEWEGYGGNVFKGLPSWSELPQQRSYLLRSLRVDNAREIAVGWPMRVVVYEYWGLSDHDQHGERYRELNSTPIRTRVLWPGVFGTLACLGVAALVGWLVGMVVFTVRNRVDRARLRADLCPRCRYPRPKHANDAGSVCPECGWVYKARETEIGYGE